MNDGDVSIFMEKYIATIACELFWIDLSKIHYEEFMFYYKSNFLSLDYAKKNYVMPFSSAGGCFLYPVGSNIAIFKINLSNLLIFIFLLCENKKNICSRKQAL